MKLMKATRSEEVVFGKGFVPVLATVFTGTEEEIVQFNRLRESGHPIHITIDPTGSVTVVSEEAWLFT